MRRTRDNAAVQNRMLVRYARLVFDRIPHGIFTVDGECRIIAFNQAAEEITGWRGQEVIGRPCAEVLRSDGCDRYCLLKDSMAAGETHRDSEMSILTRDGVEKQVSVSTAAVIDNQGHVIGGVEMFRDLTELVRLRRQLSGSYVCEDIVSKSPAMKGIRELLPLVANSDSTVLVEGEPGTGKELVARAIHNLGPRRGSPLVAVNCGAIPETLMESELFGYVSGAFTDAKRDKPGRLALAQGGTMFLDEVGELSGAMQVKLLRVLQEREYTPLGGVHSVKADVRFIAATNRDLAVEVMNNRFRQDLFYRLNIVRVVVPPLRCRTEDIPLLVRHFIGKFNILQGRRISGLSERAMSRLMAYQFPGNVRELENAVEHAFVVCGGSTIELDDLPPHLLGNQLGVQNSRHPRQDPLATAEAATVRDALARHRGHREAAARELGISRSTLWRKMKEHGIG